MGREFDYDDDFAYMRMLERQSARHGCATHPAGVLSTVDSRTAGYCDKRDSPPAILSRWRSMNGFMVCPSCTLVTEDKNRLFTTNFGSVYVELDKLFPIFE